MLAARRVAARRPQLRPLPAALSPAIAAEFRDRGFWRLVTLCRYGRPARLRRHRCQSAASDVSRRPRDGEPVLAGEPLLSECPLYRSRGFARVVVAGGAGGRVTAGLCS